MRIHITNIYGIGSTPKMAQQMVADIAKRNLHYNELGIYVFHPWDSDSAEMLRTRLDGILASVSYGDIVICQFPTWNDIEFEEAFITRLNAYVGLKKIFFIHDFIPLMWEENRYLIKRTIDLYNQADLIILSSRQMEEFLRENGLTVPKVVIQRMWDFPILTDDKELPKFSKIVNFAGDPNNSNFSFVKEWKYDGIKMAVTANAASWGEGKNIDFLGWIDDDATLINILKRNGGFGLLWTEDAYCMEYMKMNACCKVSTYLSAGLPVIVHSSIAEADTICRKNLGLVVDSLDEAVTKIGNMMEEQYNQMARNVQLYGKLTRGGYFTKKLLIDAVFKLLYE